MMMQDCKPEAGDMWLWEEDKHIYILKERLPHYDSGCYRWSTLNLTTGSYDDIVFSIGNVDRWRKLA